MNIPGGNSFWLEVPSLGGGAIELILQAVEIGKVWDDATMGFGFGRGRRFSGENGGDGGIEIVFSNGFSAGSEIGIHIIDAAPILGGAVFIEYERFGSDFGFEVVDDRMGFVD